MASAIEINRGGSRNRRKMDVLVRPPITAGVEEVGRGIGRVVFDDPGYETRVGSHAAIELSSQVQLGIDAQIVKLTVLDSRSGQKVDQTADMAVNALHACVNAMVEGETQTLRQFFPASIQGASK